MRAAALLVAALAALTAQCAPALAGFDWSVDHFGGDADRDGILDGALSPAEARDPQVPLRAVVTGEDCAPGGRYAWTLNGRAVAAAPDGRCAFRISLPREGRHVLVMDARAGEQESRTEHKLVVTEHLVVSIGDSVASGEGNPDVRSDVVRARWHQRRCHRSLLSGHAQAALRIERSDPHTAVSFVALGCSGATVPVGLMGKYAGIEPDGDLERPQLDALNGLARRREIDAVLVSIGANDSYFSRIIQFCGAVRGCPSRRFDPRTPLREARRGSRTLDEKVTSALRRLTRRYALVEAKLARSLPRARVLIVEYFDPTRRADGSPCAASIGENGITEDEFRWARERVLLRLNATIARAARRHGWGVVDGVDEAFAGHGICVRSRTERWVRTPAESFFRQDGRAAFTSFAGTMHPNAAGHRETATVIRPRLAAVLRAADDNREQPEPPDDDDDNWLLGPRGTALLVAGVALVVGLVAFLVRRRRRRVG